MEYLIRQDDVHKAFLSEGTLDVRDILRTHYGYIHDAIEKEGFILKYDRCSLFKELVFDGKVVGFCSYDFSRQFITAALNNIYVLPEFRGNGIFLNELKMTMAEHSKPSIMEPTRLVVELLIEYGFARRISDSLVASAIEFVIPGEHVLSNTDFDDGELSTHFYDLDICGSVHVLNLTEGQIAYSAPLNYDIIHYGCFERRQTIGDDYFSDMIDKFSKESFAEVISALEDALPVRKYSLEEIIGDENEFSFYIESLIDDSHVDFRKAFEIRDRIKAEYENGLICDESLLIRLAYLFNENRTPSVKSHAEICPFCHMPIDSHDRFCHFCGIKLESYQ